MYRQKKQIYVLIRDYCLWSFFVAFYCLVCSCSDAHLPTPLTEKISARFSLKLPTYGLPNTYADNPNVTKDMEIENVTILVFEANASKSGKFLYSIANPDITHDNKFTVKLKKSSIAIRIHVFANTQVANLVDTYQDQIEKDVLENIEISDDLNATYTLPMHGCVELPYIALEDISKEVQLLRSVARVDVNVKNSIPATTFRLYGVSVYFTPDRGRLVSTSDLTGSFPNVSVTTPTMPTTYNTLSSQSSVPHVSVANDGDRTITNNLFIYENKLPIFTNKLPSLTNKLSIFANQDCTKTTSSTETSSRIVVSGYYENSPNLSYYSVDFGKTNAGGSKEFIPVLRNHQYILNVNSVSGGGYDDEEEAANNLPVDITASIISWTLVEENIVFDSVNYFHVESKSFALYGGVGIQDSLLAGSNIDPADWEMSWGSTGTFSKETTLAGSHFTVKKPTKNEGGFLRFTTKNAYSTDVSEVLHIRVTNQLKFTVTVNQSDGSILTVDGRIGAIDVDVLHEGGRCRFHVLTGNASARWGASPDIDLTNMIYNYHAMGNDGGYLTVDIEPNPYTVERRGIMTISRDGADDVILNFTQDGY